MSPPSRPSRKAPSNSSMTATRCSSTRAPQRSSLSGSSTSAMASPSSRPTLPLPITSTRACPRSMSSCWVGHCAKVIAICTVHLPCRRSKWSTPTLPSCAPALFVPPLRLYDRLSADGRDQSGYGRRRPSKRRLMDASKVNGRGMYRFAELADVDTIVMDRDPDHAVATSIAEIVDDARPKSPHR